MPIWVLNLKSGKSLCYWVLLFIFFPLLESLPFERSLSFSAASYKSSVTLSWALKYQPVVYFIGKG